MTHLVPPGARERHLDIPHGRLRVLHAGDPKAGRPPLVLVHGGGTDHSGISWYRLMAPLAEDREVWAVDLPGFGGSVDTPPVGGPHELAAALGDAMATLGLGRAVVAGVSMGGDVALNLALDRPDAVAGLVLIAPGGLVPRVGGRATHFWAWLAAQLPDAILLPASRLANRFVDATLRAIVRDPATLPPEVVAEFTREARDPRGGIAYGRYNQATIGRHGMLNNLVDRVQAIGVPTLLFHGEDDPLVDPAGSRRAAERIPQARLVMVPECGHWAQLEAHDRFLAEARALLAEVDGSADDSG